jgi:hypothetical protein
MNRTILMLALALSAVACTDLTQEEQLRAACHDLLDVMELAGPGSCLSAGDERAARAQCDAQPVVVNDCTDEMLGYYDCLIDAVWVCKPEHPGAPLPADPYACADEQALYARCVRTSL